MSDGITIHEMSAEDRPREKALRLGISSLSTTELLAIVFGNGTRGKSVLVMSQEILMRHNNKLSELARRSIRQLMRENPGVGLAKAVQLAAAIELGMRCSVEEPRRLERITGSDAVWQLMRTRLGRLNHEEFWVVMLSRANMVMGELQLSIGGSAATVVDPKLMFRKVLEHGDVVSAIILVHNHPSGNLTPSSADDSLTQKIKEGGRLLDIQVLDHLIIGQSGYYSYRDEGRL